MRLFIALLCFYCLTERLAMSSVNKVAEKAWSSSTASNIYENNRPAYNVDAVEFLLENVGALKPHTEHKPFTIVELGAGTGKFTRAVLEVFRRHSVMNVRIISTEPLQEMCAKFREMVPDVEILQNSASEMGLPNNSADAILAGQCFHWFGLDQKALDEIHRVLKPEGSLGIIWNLANRSVSWIKNIEEMLDPKYVPMNIPRTNLDEVMFTALRSHGGFGNEGKDLSTYRHSMKYDLKGILDRYKTYTVVSAAPENEKHQMLQVIEKELKSNSDSQHKELYFFEFIMEMHWFKKLKY